MPNVKMLRTALGADDGIHANEYLEGESYDVSDALAGAFVGDGVAVLADAPAGAPVAATAAMVPDVAPVVKPEKNTAQKAPRRRKKSAGK